MFSDQVIKEKERRMSRLAYGVGPLQHNLSPVLTDVRHNEVGTTADRTCGDKIPSPTFLKEFNMSGKVMKKLRRLAYRGKPTDADNRRYGIAKHEKKIVIPTEVPDGKPTVKVRRSATLLCQDDRVNYQDLKKDYRRK
jgi:hypothetical protein